MEQLSTELIITFSLYSFIVFYQQKWVSEFRGSSLGFSNFLSIFMGFATMYGIGFLIYFGYKIDWISALILFGISLVIKAVLIWVEAGINIQYSIQYIAASGFILIPILGYRLLVSSGLI